MNFTGCETLNTLRGLNFSAPSFSPVISPSQTPNVQSLRRENQEYYLRVRAIRMIFASSDFARWRRYNAFSGAFSTTLHLGTHHACLLSAFILLETISLTKRLCIQRAERLLSQLVWVLAKG